MQYYWVQKEKKNVVQRLRFKSLAFICLHNINDNLLCFQIKMKKQYNVLYQFQLEFKKLKYKTL